MALMFCCAIGMHELNVPPILTEANRYHKFWGSIYIVLPAFRAFPLFHFPASNQNRALGHHCSARISWKSNYGVDTDAILSYFEQYRLCCGSDCRYFSQPVVFLGCVLRDAFVSCFSYISSVSVTRNLTATTSVN